MQQIARRIPTLRPLMHMIRDNCFVAERTVISYKKFIGWPRKLLLETHE
jgi:hypothetical protein